LECWSVLFPKVRRFTDETAAAFADLAESELASLQIESALVHLQRAHELHPALWRAAEKLAGLYLDGGDARKAAETIKAFLAGAKDDAERAQAQQLLGRIPGT
jgi:DNA-binding SARP family transcriptional activator